MTSQWKVSAVTLAILGALIAWQVYDNVTWYARIADFLAALICGDCRQRQEDIAAIHRVIDRSFWLLGLTARDFDTYRLEEVYLNDPETQIKLDLAAWVLEVKPQVGIRMPTPVSTPGMLDYWRAFYAY